MNEKRCCTCKYWVENEEEVCTNGDSKKCAEFTNYDTTCEAWEANE